MITRKTIRNFLLAALLPAVLVGCALFQSPQAIDLEGKAVRSALVEAYEARLLEVLEHAETCQDALKAIRDEEAKWAPVWKRANVAPEPPKVLTCPDSPDAG